MLPRTPCKAFHVTGTKNTSVLEEITLRGMNAEFYQVTLDGREACHCRSANSHFTHEGVDFHTGKPAAVEYTRLLHLPPKTFYHELKHFYQLPDGSKLRGPQIDVLIQEKLKEAARPKPVDPFDL